MATYDWILESINLGKADREVEIWEPSDSQLDGMCLTCGTSDVPLAHIPADDPYQNVIICAGCCLMIHAALLKHD